MPGFDGRGPLGQGPRTGGGFGYCSPQADRSAVSSAVTAVYGAGRGGVPYGGGRGRCFGGHCRMGGRRQWPVVRNGVPAPVDEKKLLEDRIDNLKAEMEALNKRLSELNQSQESI